MLLYSGYIRLLKSAVDKDNVDKIRILVILLYRKLLAYNATTVILIEMDVE